MTTLLFAAMNVVTNGEFIAWDVHPLGTEHVECVVKKNVSLKPGTMPISSLAFANSNCN